MGIKAKAVEEVKYNEHLGDLETFYEQNEKLIHKISNRYLNRIKRENLEYDDIFQIATLGFIKAYEKYDPIAFETKFSTYCVPMMVGEVSRFFRDHGHHGGLKISRTIKLLYKKILEDNAQNEDVKILAKRYETRVSYIKNALELFSVHVSSMDDEAYADKDGDSITLADQIGDECDFSGVVANEFIEYLDERDRKIVLLTMRGGLSQADIGELVGVSQVQVSRILKDRIGPLLKGYLEGKDLAEIDTRRKRPKKVEGEKMVKKKQGRPRVKEDYSYLDKKNLSKMSTKELIKEGFEPKEIAFVKGLDVRSVYSARKKLKIEQEEAQKLKQEEKKPVVKYEAFEDEIESKTQDEEKLTAPVVSTLAAKELTAPDAVYKIKVEPIKEHQEPDFELAKKILIENPDVDRVFVSEETGLTVKQVSDMRWRMKARGQGAPVKAEKKLEFNLHASSGKATKREVMGEFAKIMETITAIGADSMSYYISIQSPAELEKEE